jgi:hypothetical protein
MPMRYMPVRCMSVRCTPVRCMSMRCTPMRHGHETHAGEICAYKIHELGQCGRKAVSVTLLAQFSGRN